MLSLVFTLLALQKLNPSSMPLLPESGSATTTTTTTTSASNSISSDTKASLGKEQTTDSQKGENNTIVYNTSSVDSSSTIPADFMFDDVGSVLAQMASGSFDVSLIPVIVQGCAFPTTTTTHVYSVL